MSGFYKAVKQGILQNVKLSVWVFLNRNTSWEFITVLMYTDLCLKLFFYNTKTYFSITVTFHFVPMIQQECHDYSYLGFTPSLVDRY